MVTAMILSGHEWLVMGVGGGSPPSIIRGKEAEAEATPSPGAVTLHDKFNKCFPRTNPNNVSNVKTCDCDPE